VAGIALYLLPTMIADVRGHPHPIAIFVLNVLLGWTVLGWLAALVWSFVGSSGTSADPKRTAAGSVAT